MHVHQSALEAACVQLFKQNLDHPTPIEEQKSAKEFQLETRVNQPQIISTVSFTVYFFKCLSDFAVCKRKSICQPFFSCIHEDRIPTTFHPWKVA